ncbi:MAG: hypothetical protein IPP96_15825 [Chitinophagaceae bacterium]|nr:hypothetical protein [Chitinophagaceae bacterium]
MFFPVPQSGISNSTGYNNIAIGYKAMEDNSTGYSNTFVGMNAGKTISPVPAILFGDNTGAAMRSSNANALWKLYHGVLLRYLFV